MAHPGGRPPLFTDPQQLQDLVDNYFKNDQQPTLAGLAVSLGMSRQSLYNYEEKDQFFDIIKSARELVESLYEARLIYGSQPTGVIFALKNMNWKDKTEQDLAISGGITWNEQKTYVSPEGPMETKSDLPPHLQKMLKTKSGDVPQ